MAPSGYCIDVESELRIDACADNVFSQVMRTGFYAPGFAVLSFPRPVSPRELRRAMVALKRRLSSMLTELRGSALNYQSMGRFDQQNTTKFHLDGSPDEAILMLGYEPSRVRSRLFIADYSKCAHVMGLTPREFLEKHNPMFAAGAKLLEPYVTQVECFNPAISQIVIINNSSRALDGIGLQGVMHQAIIDTPSGTLRRVVNSTMLTVTSDNVELLSEAEQDAFVESEEISGAMKY